MAALAHRFKIVILAMLRNMIEMGSRQYHLSIGPFRRLAVLFATPPWSWMGTMQPTFPFTLTLVAAPLSNTFGYLLPVLRIAGLIRLRDGHILYCLLRGGVCTVGWSHSINFRNVSASREWPRSNRESVG